jgi:pimeloyl-ACP methyl ester carboxylesterase
MSKRAKLSVIMGAIVVFTAVGVSGAQAQRPSWPIPDGVKTIAANGYPMAYQEAGAGVPVILVHGSLSDYRTWTLQVPEFAKTNRVFAFSLRHYYPEKWDGKGDDFSITQHAHDVAAFIRALQLGKAHVVGHSRGGAVALNVARHHPDVVRTLILADASGLESLLPETPETQKMAAEGMALRKALAQNLAAGDLEKAGLEFIDALATPGSWAKLSPGLKQMFLDNMGTGVVVEGRPQITCDEIGKFGFPILLINGEKSPKRYSEMFAAMRLCKSIAVPVVIAKAAHGMQGQNPDAFNLAIKDFLARH